MDRHPTDFVELIFGLAFLATGGAYLAHEISDRSFDPAWVAAIALVTIGCACLAVTVLHRPRPDAVDEPSLEEPEP